MAELARVDGEEFPESEEAVLRRWDETGMRDLECEPPGLTVDEGAGGEATVMWVFKSLVTAGLQVVHEASLLDLRWLRPVLMASSDGV